MNPNQPRLLRVEAVADLPVLWATFQRLDLPATLDRHFPAPPHWKGPLTSSALLRTSVPGLEADARRRGRLPPLTASSGLARSRGPASEPRDFPVQVEVLVQDADRLPLPLGVRG